MEHAKSLWKETKALVAKSNKIGEREFNEVIAPIEKIHKFVNNYIYLIVPHKLTQLRMDKARELLLNTDESVKNILMSVGYIDKTSFTKKFKAYYGMSPTEYRGSNKMEN